MPISQNIDFIVDDYGNLVGATNSKLGATNQRGPDKSFAFVETNQLTGGLELQASGISAPIGGGASVLRPSGLNAYFKTFANFDIWRDAFGVVRHNFNRAAWAPTPDVQPWVTQNTYYVDGTSGADANNGSTWALAKKSISAAITVGNAAAIPYVVYVRAGSYMRNGTALAWGTTAPSQPCAFIAVGGRVVSSTGDLLTWSLNSGTTYQVTRSNSTRIYDTANLDSVSDYTEITKVAALATCQATPGTWYTDGTTTYVNRIDGAAVSDANTRVFLTATAGAAASTSGNTYVNGFDFEGGNQGPFTASNNASGRVVVENCSFKYSVDAGAYNGFTVRQLAAAAAINCVASQNAGDGFNANTLSGALPFMLTIGCVGRNNGKTGGTSNNGLTTHSGMGLLDIGGVYFGNYGGNVAIVAANTQAWLLGTRAYDSRGDIVFGGSVPPSDYLTDQASTATMWLDGCVSGGSAYGIYKPQGVVNVRGGLIAQGLNGASSY